MRSKRAPAASTCHKSESTSCLHRPQRQMPLNGDSTTTFPSPLADFASHRTDSAICFANFVSEAPPEKCTFDHQRLSSSAHTRNDEHPEYPRMSSKSILAVSTSHKSEPASVSHQRQWQRSAHGDLAMAVSKPCRRPRCRRPRCRLACRAAHAEAAASESRSASSVLHFPRSRSRCRRARSTACALKVFRGRVSFTTDFFSCRSVLLDSVPERALKARWRQGIPEAAEAARPRGLEEPGSKATGTPSPSSMVSSTVSAARPGGLVEYNGGECSQGSSAAASSVMGLGSLMVGLGTEMSLAESRESRL
mmetsp:Transcript_90660/g.227964  ORF Transcript_90660/g.227964 Transcript_90660/m.227964 type:complete len:307 (+) Transcript_90660:1370-2290(+)